MKEAKAVGTISYNYLTVARRHLAVGWAIAGTALWSFATLLLLLLALLCAGGRALLLLLPVLLLKLLDVSRL